MARYYLTTAIDYVNSRPHLGTAYEKITADVIARYRRLSGYDVRFVMGNDEHSQNVYRQARQQQLDPIAYCDRMEQEFRSVWSRLDISFDDFIRTSEDRHRAAVETFVQRAFDRGDLYQGEYEGWYCVSCEAFKQERDLENGLCPVHLRKPDWIREQNYFFRLSAFRDRLLQLYAEHPGFARPESRRNEVLRQIEDGLEDVSITRAGQAWGISLPFDRQSVVYVWYDALINYMAAVGYGRDDAMFERWWPADLHVIGKDIIRFHCVLWPAMLMSLDLPLPAQVFGHGFVLIKGQRMSKTLGTVLDPLEAADRLGPDPLRLYLTKEIVFGSDGDFTWDRFEEKYNVDLANNLGNLVNRITSMAERYRQGRLKATAPAERLADVVAAATAGYRQAMDDLVLDRGCREAFRIVDATNEYIASSEPWALARRDDQAAELDRVLWSAVEALRVSAVLLAPVMPRSAEAILERIDAPRTALSEVRLATDAAIATSGERRTSRRDPLWPRLEAGPEAPAVTVKEPMENEPVRPAPPAAPASAPATANQAELISIDDFMRVDLRVARVVAAERVPNSKKLVKLEVDLGEGPRTIVAGIAEAYEADALVGRHVVVVANLKPAKLMGVESRGMVLAASPDGGKPVLVGFDQPPPAGSRVR